jgi:DNA/RNA-binding domain of Phe-tRNA-synthetase-like protein
MFKVDPKVFEKNPGLFVGVIAVRGVDNKTKKEEVGALLRNAEEQLRKNFDPEGVNRHPHILAWRDAHKKFGNDPRRYLPSVWAVAKRVAKGGNLPRINSLVDLYNCISLRYMIPVGGEDLEKTEGDIELAYATGEELFTEIGGEENNPPDAGEVVYKDEKGVICRKFNWREADRTKLTDDTKDALIVMEVLPPFGKDVLESAMDEFQILVRQHCGGNSRAAILDGGNVSWVQ